MYSKKKGSCNPTLLFVKTKGPEVCKRETSIMLVSKVTVAVGAWVFLQSDHACPEFVPTNLATNLNVRKRSNVATISKKRMYLYLYQPPSEIRPLAVAGVKCY